MRYVESVNKIQREILYHPVTKCHDLKRKRVFKNFRPLGNRILIEREVLSELKTESGLIVNNDPSAGEMPPIGTVIAVGPGTYQNCMLIPIDVKVGDKIYFMRHADTLLDETYSVLAENAVLGVIGK